MYLGTDDLTPLCSGSKCIRDIVLTNFNQIFRISTGFCSVECWSNLIEKSCFSLIDDIHNQSFFNETFFYYNFYLEENYFKLNLDICLYCQFVCIFKMYQIL